MILPFATNDLARKTEFSDCMELAALICAAENERKKSASSGLTSDLAFVSKLHYPIWAIPWEDKILLIDGMKLVENTVLQLRPSDPEAFVENLKRSTKDQEEYLNALQNERETFAEFSFRNEVTISGFMSDKEVLSEIMNFLKDSKASISNSLQASPFIRPKTDKEDALKTGNEILDHYDKLQSEIKGLRYAMEATIDETKTHASKLQQELQQMQQDFNQQIADLTKTVNEKTSELENERDSEIERITAANNKKAYSILAEKNELEKQLLKLQQDKSEYEKRKDLRKSKKDKVGEARWKVRLQNVKKQISKVNGRTKALSGIIAKTQKETEKTTKKLTDTYNKLINEEREKIADLKEMRELKLEEKNEEIRELQQNTSVLTSNIERLIEEIKTASAKIEEATASWKITTPVLIGIPFYIIRHKVGNEVRNLIHSPVLAQEYKGLMMRIRATIGVSNLESRINSLLKPRSKQIQKLFSILERELEPDKELEAALNQIGASNNIMALVGFTEKLRKGLEELENEGWIKADEKETILRVYAPS